jgi:methionine synthase I (cobalamin-dependent)
VHRAYLDVGCDVISTNTWGLTGELDRRAGPRSRPRCTGWTSPGAACASAATRSSRPGRTGDAALAFSINGDVDGDSRREMLELLPRVFDDDPPDLVLLETMTLVRDGLTFAASRRSWRAASRLGELPPLPPRRLRRLRPALGRPEGDEFGRAVHALRGARHPALLINCLPPDHVPGMLPWLRDFTDLPLGVYPNLGYYTADGWSFDRTVHGDAVRRPRPHWRGEGAQIIGGCCGTRPSTSPPPANASATCRPVAATARSDPAAARPAAAAARPGGRARGDGHAWLDDAGRRLFPLQMPEIVCDPACSCRPRAASSSGSTCSARDRQDRRCPRHRLRHRAARDPAGAERRRARPRDRHRPPRRGEHALQRVPQRGRRPHDRRGRRPLPVGAARPLRPRRREPLPDAGRPLRQPNSHRPLDFWGRNLLDHLITLLPRLLDRDGHAYVMQLSILGQARTAELLERAGYSAKVVDFAFFDFHHLFKERKTQIERVEDLSDAYHLQFHDEDVMVAYLLEITPSGTRHEAESLCMTRRLTTSTCSPPSP